MDFHDRSYHQNNSAAKKNSGISLGNPDNTDSMFEKPPKQCSKNLLAMSVLVTEIMET